MPRIRSNQPKDQIIPNELRLISTHQLKPPKPSRAFQHDLKHILQNINQQLHNASVSIAYGQNITTHNSMGEHNTTGTFNNGITSNNHISTHSITITTEPDTITWSNAFTQLVCKTQNQFQQRDNYFAQTQQKENSHIATELLTLPELKSSVCCDSKINHAKDSKSRITQSTHDHDHEHEHFLPIDLDEAVHGAYAVAQQAIKANNNSGKGMNETEQPALQALGNESIATGVADVAVNLATAGVMIPLAALAIKAGIHETHDANLMDKKLKQQKENHSKLLELSKQDQLAKNNTIDVLNRGIKDNQLAKKVGLSSFSSGLAIALKGLLDIGITIGTGIKGALSAAGFFNSSSTLTNSATSLSVLGGLSVVGNVVLAPLTGAFATALGWFITQKSRLQLNHQKKQGNDAKVWLTQWLNRKHTEKNTISKTEKTYHAFIERQHLKRHSFFKRFKKWNQTFLIGSGLYTASAITKAVIIGVTLGGVGVALTTPVGWGLLGVGLAGALIMGIGSLAFLRGHDKQSRYANHTHADHPDIDRHFYAEASLIDLDKTLETSTKTLEWLDAKKTLLNTVLKQSAALSQTFEPGNIERSLINRLRNRWLKHEHIEQFLQSETGKVVLKDEFKNLLNKKIKHLVAKLNCQKILSNQMLEQLNHKINNQDTSLDSASNIHLLEQMVERVTQRDQTQEKDQSQLENARAMLMQLNNDDLDQIPWSLLAAELNLEQSTNNVTIFSEHLLEDGKKQIKQARGVLYETHLEMYQAQELIFKESTKSNT